MSNMKPSQFLTERAIRYNIQYPNMTVTDFLEKNNGSHLDQIALMYYGNNPTYETLFKNIYEYNKAFAACGLKKGDYVSVCLPTIPEAIYIFYALNKMGVKFHTILPMASTEQIVEILKANKSEMFITLDSLYYRVGDALKAVDMPFKIKVSANTSLPPGIKQIKMFSDFLKKETYKDIPSSFMGTKELLKLGKNGEMVSVPWEEGKVAAITNSSGSTANNKATELTDFGFNAMVCNYMAALPHLKRGSTFHSCIPLLYSTGMSNSVNLPLQLGFTTILEPIFNKDTYPEAFMKKKPNLSIVPPPHAKALLDYLRIEYAKKNPKNKNMLSFVEVFSTGGASLPIPWEEELEYYLNYFGSSAYIGKGYGLSEHSSALTVSVERMIGSSGKVLPGVVFGVYDIETGEELDFGQEGILRAHSPADMGKYFNDDELTNAYFAYDENGVRWGNTGDIGKIELINGEPWLFFSGRAKEIVNINGKSILLPKIQNKIFECHLVDECEVVMMKKDGKDYPVAHIKLKDDCLTQKEILEALKKPFEDSSEFEPFAYMFHSKLPVLISGKPDKLTLENMKNGYVRLEEEQVTCVDFGEPQQVLKKTS